MGVISPVKTVGRTLCSGQFRRRGTGGDGDLVGVLGQRLHGECHGGRRQLHNGIDLFGVVPLARDVGCDIGLVLVVGGHDLDRLAQHGTTEIFDSHQCGLV